MAAAHDGLRAGQRDAGIVSLAESAVPVAGEKVADLGEPHGPIGLGVAAAPHVEVEDARLVLENLDRQRVVPGPQMLDRLEALEIGAARRALRHVRAGRDRRPPDGLPQNFASFFLSDLCAQLLVDRRDDAGLDPAAGRDAEIFRRVAGCHLKISSSSI